MSGSLLAMPMLVINMGGEMVYILEQRLRAQNIPGDKSRKGGSTTAAVPLWRGCALRDVRDHATPARCRPPPPPPAVLSDVVKTMYSKKFIAELFKPQPLYSNRSTRQIFDRLAHSSIMRLNENSMDKVRSPSAAACAACRRACIHAVHAVCVQPCLSPLPLLCTCWRMLSPMLLAVVLTFFAPRTTCSRYQHPPPPTHPRVPQLYDLMTMGFKYQMICCATPVHLMQLTLNHLESLIAIVDNPSVAELIEGAKSFVTSVRVRDVACVQRMLLATVAVRRLRFGCAALASDSGCTWRPLRRSTAACLSASSSR